MIAVREIIHKPPNENNMFLFLQPSIDLDAYHFICPLLILKVLTCPQCSTHRVLSTSV